MRKYISTLNKIRDDICLALDIASEIGGLTRKELDKAEKDLALANMLIEHAYAGHWAFKKPIELFIARSPEAQNA